jgi:phycocyanobilin:ferredoxin oxidoreductase
MTGFSMNFMNLLHETADKLAATISSHPAASRLATKDYGWENHRWVSPDFRLAHLEVFDRDSFMVVHCCVFPHVDDASPIFGFDVIASETKVTGVFMDLSPTLLPSVPFADLDIEKARQRPEWGDIFSENWIACRPTADEMQAIAAESVKLLDRYLQSLRQPTIDTAGVIAAQDHYCLQQRKNEHTYRAIKNLLGDQLAEEFISTVLFPTIKEPI